MKDVILLRLLEASEALQSSGGALRTLCVYSRCNSEVLVAVKEDEGKGVYSYLSLTNQAALMNCSYDIILKVMH